MTEIGESATEFLDDAMSPHDDVRGGLDDGGWKLDIQNVSLAADNGDWRLAGRVTVTYLTEPLLTRARLEAYLLSPFDTQPRIHTLEQALDTTVIAAVRRTLARGRGHVAHWQLSTSATH
jgi:hypothetical protein